MSLDERVLSAWFATAQEFGPAPSAILEWTGNGDRKEATDTPGSEISVSVVAGEGFEPPTHGL